MDKQQIFDTGVSGIINQGRPAIGRDGLCAYRTADGAKCFLGMFIPDDNYDPTLERLGPDDQELTNVMGLPNADEDIRSFLNDCQSIHDDAAAQSKGDDALFLTDFKDRALKLAEFWQLEQGVVT